MATIHYIDEQTISGKRIILRVDFNVSMNPNYTIADDERIRQAVPTIKLLLQNKNKLVIISHLNRPKERNDHDSLSIVCQKLQEYIPDYTVKLISDFQTENPQTFTNQTEKEVFVLENIRFYPEEKKNDPVFAQQLAKLGEVFVNDAFGVSHRPDTSLVGLPPLMPAYGGLLMRKEIEMITKAITNPQKPVVAILGGAKISSKINLIGKLMNIADYLLIGGGIANTFFCAQGFQIGKSFCQYDEAENARRILFQAAQSHTRLVLPTDAVVGVPEDTNNGGEIVHVQQIPAEKQILDIGPDTQAQFGSIIATAKTIIWNGPVGYFENQEYRRGTDFIYYSIAHNTDCISIVGGGDTLAAISKKEYLEKITHISTGGGAMLEFIENGTLPGIEALKQ